VKIARFGMIVRYNDKKCGYGTTVYPDSQLEQQGKYRDNVLIADTKKDSRRLFMLRLSKLKDRTNYAVVTAHKAAETAAFKADIAAARFTYSVYCGPTIVTVLGRKVHNAVPLHSVSVYLSVRLSATETSERIEVLLVQGGDSWDTLC